MGYKTGKLDFPLVCTLKTPSTTPQLRIQSCQENGPPWNYNTEGSRGSLWLPPGPGRRKVLSVLFVWIGLLPDATVSFVANLEPKQQWVRISWMYDDIMLCSHWSPLHMQTSIVTMTALVAEAQNWPLGFLVSILIVWYFFLIFTLSAMFFFYMFVIYTCGCVHIILVLLHVCESQLLTFGAVPHKPLIFVLLMFLLAYIYYA